MPRLFHRSQFPPGATLRLASGLGYAVAATPAGQGPAGPPRQHRQAASGRQPDGGKLRERTDGRDHGGTGRASPPRPATLRRPRRTAATAKGKGGKGPRAGEGRAHDAPGIAAPPPCTQTHVDPAAGPRHRVAPWHGPSRHGASGVAHSSVAHHRSVSASRVRVPPPADFIFPTPARRRTGAAGGRYGSGGALAASPPGQLPFWGTERAGQMIGNPIVPQGSLLSSSGEKVRGRGWAPTTVAVIACSRAERRTTAGEA